MFGYVSSIVKDDPVRSRADIEAKINYNEMTGFAYFRDGQAIGQLRSEEDRRPVTYQQIPQSVIDAVIAIEDNHFNEHIGVDFKGTLRAVKQRLLHESVQTGGSTLTQQLARRVFLNWNARKTGRSRKYCWRSGWNVFYPRKKSLRLI
ncbi:hypothetical protein HMSSN036_21910 [Paenibacillus macerans]|nr:hypothetical protein HMSSN036_21910 [Paenibacillus macerans]